MKAKIKYVSGDGKKISLFGKRFSEGHYSLTYIYKFNLIMEKKDDNNPEMVRIYKDSRRCKYWFVICLILAVLMSIFIIIFVIWAIFS